MMDKGGDEECRLRERRVPGEPEAQWRRQRRELVERALARFPPPEPQPSQEEVDSVFRRVMASY